MSDTRLSRLSWTQIIALSAPAMVLAAYQISMSVFAPAFLVEHVGLPLATISGIMLLARLWDMVNDPIVGVLTDATSTPIGRRRPWILCGAPIALLGTWQFYFATPGTDSTAILWWMIVLNTGWTMVTVAHGAWGVEVSKDYDERSRIFGFKMLAVAAALPIISLGPAILERTIGATAAQQMHLMGFVVLIVLPLSIAWLVWKTPEASLPRGRLNLAAFIESFTIVFTRKSFAIISAAYLFVGLADAVSSTIYLFLVRDGLGLPGWAATFLVVQAVFGFISIPTWYAVSRRTDKRSALLIVFGLQVLIAPILLILPAGNVAAFVGFTMAKGLIWGAEYMLLRAIVSDLVDEDAARTGAHRAGVFYSSFNLTIGLAGALGGAGALWLLAQIGFDPRASAIDRAAHAGALRWIAAATPFLCTAAGFALIAHFDGRRVKPVPAGADDALNAATLAEPSALVRQAPPSERDMRIAE